MYKKKIGINTQDMSREDITFFVQAFDELINHSGPGGKSAFIKQLNIGPVDGLRVCLGVPESWLTDERQQVIESVYSYVFDKPFIVRHELWIDNPTFPIKNSKHSADVLLDDCVIDFDFMESLGFKLPVWEEAVLKTSLKSYRQRIDAGNSVKEQNFRMLIALSVFGFSEPYEFFIKP